MTGTTISHYRILAELGRGGMGIVYRAEDTRLGREVAIKVLPTDQLASQASAARFYREAHAAAQLSHPGIATVHEIDAYNGEACQWGRAHQDLLPLDTRPLKRSSASSGATS